MTAVVLCLISAAVSGAAVWLLCTRRAAVPQTAQQQLADIERSLHAAGSGVYSYFPGDNLATCSSVTATLLGLPAQRTRLSAEEWTQLIHPDDRAAAVRKISEAIAKGAPYVVDYRVPLPDGK